MSDCRCTCECHLTDEQREERAFQRTKKALSLPPRRLSITVGPPKVHVNVTHTFSSHPPRFQPPTTPDPDRPRGI